MALSVGSFLRKEIFHPCDTAVPSNKRCTLLIASIVAGIFTAGLLHLFCYIFLYDRSIKVKPPEKQITDVASVAMLPGPVPVERALLKFPKTEMPKKDENKQGSSNKDPEDSGRRDPNPKPFESVVTTPVTHLKEPVLNFATVLPGSTTLESLTVRLPHSEMPKKDENNEGSSKKDPEDSQRKDPNTPLPETVDTTPAIVPKEPVILTEPKTDPALDPKANAHASQLAPIPSRAEIIDAVVSPEPVTIPKPVAIIKKTVAHPLPPLPHLHTLKLSPDSILLSGGKQNEFLKAEVERDFALYLWRTHPLDFPLAFLLISGEEELRAFHAIDISYQFEMKQWLELCGQYLITTQIDKRIKIYNQQIDLKERIKRLNWPIKGVFTLRNLLAPWEKSPLKYALMMDDELVSLKIGDCASIVEGIDLLKKRIRQLSTENRPVALDTKDAEQLLLTELPWLTAERLKAIANKVPPVAFHLLTPGAICHTDSNGNTVELNLSNLSDEQLNELFSVPENVAVIKLEQIYANIGRIPKTKLTNLTEEQILNFDFTRVAKPEEIFPVLYNDDNTHQLIPKLALSKLYQVLPFLSVKHVRHIDEKTLLAFDFSLIEDLEQRKKALNLLYAGYHVNSMKQWNLEKVYKYMACFSELHWTQGVNPELAKDFDFSKVAPEERATYFRRLFGSAADEGRANHRISELSMEKVNELWIYFEPVHWKAIEDHTIAVTFDFNKITDPKKRQEAFNLVFRTEGFSQTARTRIEKISFAKFDAMMPLFSDAHWALVSDDQACNFDFNEIADPTQRTKVFNILFKADGLYAPAKVRIRLLTNEGLYPLLPHFSKDHWGHVTDHQAITFDFNKIADLAARQAAFNFLFSIEGGSYSKARTRIPKLPIATLYVMMPLFSKYHWKEVSKEQALAFDFTKITEATDDVKGPDVPLAKMLFTRQEVFNLLFYVEGEPNTGDRLNGFELEKLYAMISYFLPGHWKAISEKNALAFDLERITDLAKRKEVFNILFSVEQNRSIYTTPANQIKNLSLETIYKKIACFSDEQWAYLSDKQAIAFDFSKITDLAQRKKVFNILFNTTVVGFASSKAQDRIPNLSPEQLDAVISLFSEDHWKCLKEKQLLVFDFSKITDPILRKTVFNLLFSIKAIGFSSSLAQDRIPKLSQEHLYALMPLFSEDHWKSVSKDQAVAFDFTKLPEATDDVKGTEVSAQKLLTRQEVFNLLFYVNGTPNTGDRLNGFELEKLYKMMHYFSPGHWKALSEKNALAFDLDRITDPAKRKEIFNILFSVEQDRFTYSTPARKITKLSLETIYKNIECFSDEQWKYLSVEQAIKFDFSKITDLVQRKKVFNILFSTYSEGYSSDAQDRIPKLSQTQLYAMMALFSEGHWKAISKTQALAFDFTKIPEATDDVKGEEVPSPKLLTRQEVFNLLFYVNGTPNNGDRLNDFKLETIYTMMDYFAPGHWKAISAKYAKTFDFTKIPAIEKRKAVFDSLFSLEMDRSSYTTPANQLRTLDLEKIYELSQYFSEGHLDYVDDKSQLECDLARLPEKLRIPAFNRWYSLVAVLGYTPASKLRGLSLAKIEKLSPYFSVGHWDCVSEDNQLAFDFNKIDEKDRRTVFNRWFSLVGVLGYTPASKLRHLSLEKIEKLSPYFSLGHWEYVSEENILAFDFNKIDEKDRRTVFNRLFDLKITFSYTPATKLKHLKTEQAIKWKDLLTPAHRKHLAAPVLSALESAEKALSSK